MLHILLSIFLFVYPWQQQPSAQEQLLAKGMYTFTGRFVSNDGTFSENGPCHAVHVKIYETKLVVTQQQLQSPEYFDTTYPYVGKDKAGNRIYRLNNTDQYLVDNNFEMEHVMSYTTYNGNVTNNTRYEMIKGDYSAECLKQLENKLYNNPMFWNY